MSWRPKNLGSMRPVARRDAARELTRRQLGSHRPKPYNELKVLFFRLVRLWLSAIVPRMPELPGNDLIPLATSVFAPSTTRGGGATPIAGASPHRMRARNGRNKTMCGWPALEQAHSAAGLFYERIRYPCSFFLALPPCALSYPMMERQLVLVAQAKATNLHRELHTPPPYGTQVPLRRWRPKPGMDVDPSSVREVRCTCPLGGRGRSHTRKGERGWPPAMG